MGFFNDVGDWINNNIIQPIGKVWNEGIENIKQNRTIYDQIDEKIKENNIPEKMVKGMENIKNSEIGENIIQPIQNKVTDAVIDYNPLYTDETKKELKGMKENAINGNLPETKKEQDKGNLQDIENSQNIPSIKELWEREDAIRKETQEREDTAYQRAVEDMRKAGINPNLVGVNPANSGGGIISATGQNLINTEMSGIINTAIAEINNTVKANENQKDRINEIIKTLAMYMLLKK